ncbi:MAG: TonB-dependent receptor [Luteimonas sp.]|nr:TonB-dependent receptor [Luteimonas sp.]
MRNLKVPRSNLLYVALLAAITVPAAAQDGGQAATTTLDKVSVTGSRIKRTDIETALPITVIRKEEIQAQGITSAEQMLQYLNIAGNGSDNLVAQVGVGSDEMRGNNGVSGANLRGQGADATLVLLNGRRVATHGLRGQAVDLNSIPFAAIDRVEVLRDGASAVYGTDAIGGVINFITRTDYEGIIVNAGFDVTQDGGGNIYSYNVLGGVGDIDEDRWNVWGTVGWKRNEILRGIDRDFTNTFQPDRGLSPDTRGTPYATVSNAAGGIITGSLPDPLGGGNQSFINPLDLPGGPGCEAGSDMMGPYEHVLWGVSSAKYACAWDYPRARVIQQPVDSVQALGRASFRIGESHMFYVEAMGSRVKSNRQFEYQQITSGSATSSLPPSTWYPLNDITRATYNGVYESIRQFFYPGSAPLTSVGNLVYGNRIPYRWRCEVCGPREILTTTTAWRLLAGMEGDIGSWNYDVGLSRASSKAESTLGNGYYFTTEFQQALGSGYINPFIMPGQEQSQQGIAMLEAASAAGVKLYGGESVVTTVDANFAGGLGFDLWGGEVQLATGFELRREEFGFAGKREGANALREIYQAPFDVNNDQPDVSRDVKALYVEAYLPVHDTFELTLAARRDQYDVFGSTTNPKYSFKWQPLDWLAFRGAYSTGFKAPEFTRLYGGRLSGEYTGTDLADPATCPGGRPSAAPGCAALVRPEQVFGGNIDLKPETSKQRSIGVVFAPAGNFNLSLDWWEIERLNTIRSPDITMLRDSYAVFSDRWVRNPDGSLDYLDRTFANTGGTLMSGIELDTTVNGELAGGSWNINLNGSYIDNFQQRVVTNLPYSPNLVGKYVRYYNLPLKWKHTLNFSYAKGDWSHTLTQVYRNGYKDELPSSMDRAVPTLIPVDWNPDVDRYITYNYGVAWTGMDSAKITFVVRNLLNTDPPFTAHQNDFASGAAWEDRIADPRGRSFNLMVEYEFN